MLEPLVSTIPRAAQRGVRAGAKPVRLHGPTTSVGCPFRTAKSSGIAGRRFEGCNSLTMSTKSRQTIWGGSIRGAKIRAEGARKRAAEAIREADRAEAEEDGAAIAWSKKPSEGYRLGDGHRGHAGRAVQEPGSCCGIHHGGGMVAGRVGGCSARGAAALRRSGSAFFLTPLSSSSIGTRDRIPRSNCR